MKTLDAPALSQEAKARVEAAHALGQRRTLSGERLEPIYPATAAALTAGAISPRHAAAVVGTVEKLPVEIRATGDRIIEAILLDAAGTCDPQELRSIARRLAYRLDQDGQSNEIAHRARTRGLSAHQRLDGSGQVVIDATAELMEHLLTVLDATSAPNPADDGTRDPRTPAQRRHDGLLDALQRLVGSGRLPASKGVTTTVILTMDADTWATTGNSDSP